MAILDKAKPQSPFTPQPTTLRSYSTKHKAALLSLPELEQGTDSNQSTGQARVGKVFCGSPSMGRCRNTARIGSTKEDYLRDMHCPQLGSSGIRHKNSGRLGWKYKGKSPLDYREEETRLSPWGRVSLLTTHSSATLLTPGIAHYTSALCLELKEKNGYPMSTTSIG